MGLKLLLLCQILNVKVLMDICDRNVVIIVFTPAVAPNDVKPSSGTALTTTFYTFSTSFTNAENPIYCIFFAEPRWTGIQLPSSIYQRGSGAVGDIYHWTSSSG